MPRAAPREIADRISQFSGVLPAPLFPVEGKIQIDGGEHDFSKRKS